MFRAINAAGEVVQVFETREEAERGWQRNRPPVAACNHLPAAYHGMRSSPCRSAAMELTVVPIVKPDDANFIFGRRVCRDNTVEPTIARRPAHSRNAGAVKGTIHDLSPVLCRGLRTLSARKRTRCAPFECSFLASQNLQPAQNVFSSNRC